jgi:osmotically-inducible protein OsmY
MIASAAIYYWKERLATLAQGARQLGSEGEGALAGVGQKLQDAKTNAAVHTALGLRRTLKPLKGTDLKVRAYRRDLTVGGVVDSPDQRALAIELARDTPGVGDVVDQIQVRGAAAAKASTAAALPSGVPVDNAVLVRP